MGDIFTSTQLFNVSFGKLNIKHQRVPKKRLVGSTGLRPDPTKKKFRKELFLKLRTTPDNKTVINHPQITVTNH